MIAFILCGIPGSGKSTFISKYLAKHPVVSRDIIRAELGYTDSVDEKAVLSYEKERNVTEKEYEMMENLISNNTSFVIDDTNTGRFRKELIDFLKEHDVITVGINIDTPLDICVKRRKNQIPEEKLVVLYERMIPIKETEVDILLNEKGY